MSIQVARGGKVIRTLASLDELRAEVRAGRVLPSDHYIFVGAPEWSLVASLPQGSVLGHQEAWRNRKDDDEKQIDRVRAEICALIQEPAREKPACCSHCKAAELRAAKLVWQQSTRVGGAIDSNLDLAVFGSTSLQGLDVKPPPEASVPGPLSGGYLVLLGAAFVLVVVPGLINAPLMLVFMLAGFFNERGFTFEITNPMRALAVFYYIVIFYLGFLAARRYLRANLQSGRIGFCETQLKRAKAHSEWRNTWICLSCGGKTVAR